MFSGDETKPFPCSLRLKSTEGQVYFRKSLGESADRIWSVVSSHAEAVGLQWDVKAVWYGRHSDGYMLGVVDGYSAARSLLKKDRGLTLTIVRIIRRNPHWSTMQICNRLDALGKAIPKNLLRKNTELRGWVDAVKNRNSRQTRRIEKYISRIRLTTRRMVEARGWKSYVRGVLP